MKQKSKVNNTNTYLWSLYRLWLLYPRLHNLLDAYYNQPLVIFDVKINNMYKMLLKDIEILISRDYERFKIIKELISNTPIPSDLTDIANVSDNSIEWIEGYGSFSANIITKIEELYFDEGSPTDKLSLEEERNLENINYTINNMQSNGKDFIDFISANKNENETYKYNEFELTVDKSQGNATIFDSKLWQFYKIGPYTNSKKFTYIKYLFTHPELWVSAKDLYESFNQETKFDNKKRYKANQDVEKDVIRFKNEIKESLPSLDIIIQNGGFTLQKTQTP